MLLWNEEMETFIISVLYQRTILPDNFLYKEIPSYKYLVVEHIGAMEKIYETYGKIYQEIIPNTPYTPIKILSCTLKNMITVSIGIEIIQLLKFGYLFKIRNNFISIVFFFYFFIFFFFLINME